MDVLVVTPVKDSPETTRLTIKAVTEAEGNFAYILFDDFSGSATKTLLNEFHELYGFRLIHLDDYTDNPSPNYKLILEMAQTMALEHNVPLLLIESDVIIDKNTIVKLLEIYSGLHKPGLVGAITIDQSGNFNFPYSYVKKEDSTIISTRRSLSFCCTLMSLEFLHCYDFKRLSDRKDWYDVYISRQSRSFGFINYLATNLRVLHLPHSSRPWKQLKYTNPLKYYYFKFLKHRDRI